SSLTTKLAADGKNWKDWSKQVENWAVAHKALPILKGKLARPSYNPGDTSWMLHTEEQPKLTTTMDAAGKLAEFKRCEEYNKNVRPLNESTRKAKERAQKEHDDWAIRDAELQNTIIATVDSALATTIRSCLSAAEMYKTVGELNAVSGHGNLRNVWAAFVDLRADNQKSIRGYMGAFRNALIDVTNQGIILSYKKTMEDGTTKIDKDTLEELLVAHFLLGLRRVLPDWVEARENDMRQGKVWTVDLLMASLEDRICNEKDDPIKIFIVKAKKEEEDRVNKRVTDR
ncbi:hypothetical protein K469DRAFT_463474, partial [Zopfia rhizophila CBS 207.26]